MAEGYYNNMVTNGYLSNLDNKKIADRFRENIELTKAAFETHAVTVPKKKVDVLLDGVIYTICSSEDETYMQKVAFYLNQKIAETRKYDSSKNLDSRAVALLTSLNVADDYCKLLDASNAQEIEKQKLDSELTIYKKEYDHVNKENELLKAEIENLKMQLLRETNHNIPRKSESENNNYEF